MTPKQKIDYMHEILCSEISKYGELILRVKTNSMEPAIHPLDRVVISPCLYESLFPGDMVVFKDKSDFIIHRMVSKYVNGKEYIITKGDRSPFFDPPVRFDKLLGKITGIIKFGTGKLIHADSLWFKILSLLNIVFWIPFSLKYKWRFKTLWGL
ncbi:MAG: hypothetical protein A2161_15850 [Candidatus Schekmanbacteria bacterium RBG_13_48_7]|uniref:Signal peptidase I n=1 Tax=Candidatus Schekmanbacteria bacterium RBG_13_48_7 TaxID=1817878 RepID=A0A1F7RRE6_9BACT|nr:MAG: hypothetical protein A2161_15850 [Candidatus Schekmanbacteria bacterium RBG_13_48_7]